MGNYNTQTIYDINDVNEIYQSAFIVNQFYSGYFNIEQHPINTSELDLNNLPDSYDQILEYWLSEHNAGQRKLKNQPWRTQVTNHLIHAFANKINNDYIKEFPHSLDCWIFENWNRINIRSCPNKFLSIWTDQDKDPTPIDILSTNSGIVYRFDLNNTLKTNEKEVGGIRLSPECHDAMLAIVYLHFNRVIDITNHKFSDVDFKKILTSENYSLFLKLILSIKDITALASAPNEYKIVIGAMFNKFGDDINAEEKSEELIKWISKNKGLYNFIYSQDHSIIITYADDEMDAKDTEFYSRSDVDYLLGIGNKTQNKDTMPESLLECPPHCDKLEFWALKMSIWGKREHYESESDRRKIHELATHWTIEAFKRKKNSRSSVFVKSKYNNPFELGGLRKTISMLTKYNYLDDALKMCNACIHYGLEASDAKTSFPDLLAKINKKITQAEQEKNKDGRHGKLSQAQILDLVSKYIKLKGNAEGRKNLMEEFGISYSYMTFLASKNKHLID